METLTKVASTGGVKEYFNTPSEEIIRLYKLQIQNRQAVKNTTSSQRKTKLKELEKKLFTYRQEIRDALYADFKKAPAETDITEIYTSLTEIRHAVKNLSEWMRPTRVDTPLSFMGTSAKVVYEPKGTCLIISPWNYPFNLCIIPLVSAIAAGNTAVIKPSEFTPHTAKIIKKITGEIFKENEVAVVEGDYKVSSELLKLKWDHIFFTGSPQVGKIVMKAAAEHLTSVTLELGGKSPVIVDETANLKAAAKRIAWGKLINNGQTCIAPDYLYVHESRYDDFLKEMKSSVGRAYGENPDQIKSNPDYCRIINHKHYGRIKELIEDAINKGANVYYGAKLDDGEDYISPTILTDVPKDARIMEEEIFGPVLPVLKYSRIEEPIEVINSFEKPLALYVFSNSSNNINKVLENTTAGGTTINDTMLHNTHPNLPFGGVNNSGIGSAHGYYGFKAFSHERAVLKQWSPAPSAENLYPPYNRGFVKRMIEFTLKYF